jgi:hypothetical protein
MPKESLVFAVALVACARESAPAAPTQSPPAQAIASSASSAPAAHVSTPDLSRTPADGGDLRSAPVELAFRAVALPGVSPPAFLDYIAWEAARARVWVPVANTGSVDVLSTADNTFARVDGFKTAEREIRGKKRTMGPSAVSIGDGFAYIGNRATGEVCPVDTGTLKAAKCLKLPSNTDGVAYVASAKEVWVTTPGDRAIVVLDASAGNALRVKTTVKLDGAPEGYAADESRSVFFTNLEDKNKTVAIDLKTHQPKASWDADCGSAGPRGIAAEVSHGLVFVACTNRLLVLDAGHGGARVGELDVGDGIDNIDWLEPQRSLYIAAARAAQFVIAHVDESGQPTVVASGAVPEGARNAVADASGTAYVTDPAGARLLVFPHAP